MSKLTEYILKYASRGDCTCGKCIDAPDNPKQPNGHTVNMTFFKVAANEGADAKMFQSLVELDFLHWLDGKEHNYLTIGGELGDQGIAIMCVGLGHLLGVWKALTPDTVMPFMPEGMKHQMAGMGMVSLQANKNLSKDKVGENPTF